MDATQDPSQSDASPQENTAGKLSSAQIEKIADENGEVYRRDVFKTSWKTHTQSLWAGGLFGIVVGSSIGALSVLSTLLVGVAPVTIGLMFWPVVGTFAVFGMAMGVAKFTAVGATTGAVVGGEKVADRKKLLKNPVGEIQDHIQYHGTLKEKQTFWNRIIPFAKGSKEIINWRAALAFTAAGLALGGLLIATGGASAIVGALPAVANAIGVGSAAFIPAKIVTCMTLTACGLFGAVFSVDMPTIAANMTEFVAGIFSGKSFQRSKERCPELAKAAAAAIPRSAQVCAPVVFKNTTSTLGSPIGAYAGEAPAQHLRKLAEQKFNAMQSSRGTAIN